MLFFRYIFPLLLIFLFSFTFALPPAGIVISNTAKIEYEDETGFKYKDFSNTVFVTVKQIYGISIEPDLQTITSFPDSEVNIPYILKNTGNGKDKFLLKVKNQINDSGDIQNLKIYVDTNENGVVDPGEQEYNNTNPPTLDINGYIPLVVVGKVPANPSSGLYKISIEGYSYGNDQIFDLENITQIKVNPSFSITLNKNTNKQEVFPGEELTFSINIHNQGTETIKGTIVQTDFDNDNNPESRNGILLVDKLPKYVKLRSSNIFLINGITLYKGLLDNYWKDSLDKIHGNLESVALFIDSLDPDQQAKFEILVEIDNDAPAGIIENKSTLYTENEILDSNIVSVNIKEKQLIILDDTDDNGSYTGSDSYTDNDDSMVVYSMTSGEGMYVDFLNEAWNLGNTPQVINIFWDKGSSRNIDNTNIKVLFFDKNGNPLIDTDGDGYNDLGIVNPGERVEFITRVYVLSGKFKDVVIAIKGFSKDINNANFTFDIIKDIQPATAVVQVTVAASAGLEQEKLNKQKLIIYEFDENGNRTKTPPIILWTDENGYILYDNDGNIKTLYSVLEEGKKYRLTIYGEYKNRNYTLSPFIEKRYFDEVENTGDEKCWDRIGNEVECTTNRSIVKIKVLDNGTKELILPLDPAGYVYDPVTNEKINNACVYFYKCTDDSCTSYILVDNDLLDIHSNPDAGWQTNPQLTSDIYGAAGGEGTFEFIFRNFVPGLRGWYFLEVDFECTGADTTLKDKYEPIRLKKDEIWDPNEDANKPYTGEKFYIDENFPEPMMILPLGRPVKKNLIVKKSVYPSVASLGDFIKWKIFVKNNGDLIAYDVNVNDYLPRGFRYRKGTTKIEGITSSDPLISSNGRILTWKIGNIDPGEEKVIEFYTSVITSAQEGKHKNTADAQGWADTAHTTKIVSNQGFAYIKVTRGIFTDKGYIFGKVFIDQNKNRIHDENEPIIKGAKIYLDNGRYAVTDVEGKFHFDNLNPRTYVVKIDKTSLPKGAKLLVLNNRNAGDPGTVFADVYPGEMHKVNFALAPFNPDVEIFQLKQKIKGKLKVERGIEDIIVEPLKENIKVKHYLSLENTSSEPLYEVKYTEKSEAVPEKGTVYINNAPFKDPEIKNAYFSWNIPVLLPKEKIKITWISPVRKGILKPSAEISLKINPTEKDISLPVTIPIVFDVIKDKEYNLTIYFDFGKAILTPQAKKSLENLVKFLRKTNFKHLYIKIKGHTDAVRVINPKIKNNTNLSLLRAETVKNFLKKHLIDLGRVEIK